MEKITSKRALYFVPGRSQDERERREDVQADEKVKEKFPLRSTAAAVCTPALIARLLRRGHI